MHHLKRYLFSGLLGLAASVSFASTPAQQCETLTCVRQGIDAINTKIVNLIGERLRYVKRAGELKKKPQAVSDPRRNAAILQAVGQAAEQAGYSPKIAQAIFTTILQQSIQFERQFHVLEPLKKE